MGDSLFDEISKLCADGQDDQLNDAMQIKEHTNEHAIIQSINKHVARLLTVQPPLEIKEDDPLPLDESVNLLARAVLAESRLAERDDEYHRMHGRMRELQQALASLTSENMKLNEQLTSTPIIAPALRSQRPSLIAALTSIESRHEQQIAELKHKHAQELEHTLQYKYLFAQLASRKEDLELALELEKQKTRKTRSLIEKCIQVTAQFEAQEQRLASTTARLAEQLLLAGIPIKNNAVATNQLASDSYSGIEVFTDADRSLIAELLAPSVRQTPIVRSPTTSPPRTPRTPSVPALPPHVLTMPSSMTAPRPDMSSLSSATRPDMSSISSASFASQHSINQPANQSTAKWMSWPKGWSRKGGSSQAHV